LKVDPAGRIVIPAGVRRRHGIVRGGDLVLREGEEGLRLETFGDALRRAQAYFSGLAGTGESVAEELIRERRQEAAAEDLE
jgi:AbrB family looped-hinge helix DNA binding protein